MKTKLAFFAVIGIIVSLIWGMGGFVFFNFVGVKAANDNEGQTVNLTVAQTITLTLGSGTISLGTLTPSTPVSATTSATVATNSNTGWEFHANNNSGTSTMYLVADPSAGIPDYTAWDPTANAGAGNATTTPGATLSLRTVSAGTSPSGLYSATWWGASDVDGTAKYAGFPTSATKISEIASFQSGDQTVVYKLRADAPTTQRSGSYTGGITMTALTKP